jgi:ubiquitin related modifier 1
MAQSIASGSTSNGLGYSSKQEIAAEEPVVEKSGGKAGGKGEDELEIRIEFGSVQLLLLTPLLSFCALLHGGRHISW